MNLVALGGRGAERILNIFRPGDVFGEILFSVESRPFDAIALDEARVAIMRRVTFQDFLQRSNQWGLSFTRIVSDRLFVVERDLAALSHTWTRPRLIHLPLKLADNLGESKTDGGSYPGAGDSRDAGQHDRGEPGPRHLHPEPTAARGAAVQARPLSGGSPRGLEEVDGPRR